MMMPTITAGIQPKLTKNKFNNSYNIYQRLKELLQSIDKT